MKRRAYLVQIRIVNEAECVVHATSRDDALRRFRGGEVDPVATGVDYRIGQPSVRRVPSEDAYEDAGNPR